MWKKIASDKRKHFIAGIVVGAVLQTAAWALLPDKPVVGALLAFAGVVAISYGFELVSLITGKGHHDIMDAVASIIGGIAGMGLNWALLLALQRSLA